MTKYVLNSGRWSSVKDRALLLARVVKGLNLRINSGLLFSLSAFDSSGNAACVTPW